jgi:predicted deacylase
MQTQLTPLVSTTLGTNRELVSFHFGTPGAGEKVYVQASLHADETPAMLTAWQLKQRLMTLEADGRVRGEVVLVPVANPVGLSQHVLGQFLGRFEANSGHNFNRSFPMPAAEALIARVGTAWTGDAPLARYIGANGVLLATDSGGQSFDEIHTLLWNEVRTLLGETPLAAPNIAVTLEHRGQRDVSYEAAQQDADAIVEFLVRRWVIEGEARALPPLLHPAAPLAGSEQFVAPVAGVVVYRASVGAFVKAGDPVFDIVDPLTDAVTTVTTKNDGVFYMRRAIRFAYAGAPMGRVSGERAFRTGVLIGA